jgi:hypothetical protein
MTAKTSEREGVGKGSGQKERKGDASKREGGREKITKERQGGTDSADKPTHMTAGEKEGERYEIKNSGRRTLVITVREIDAKSLRKSSRWSPLFIPPCQIEAKPLRKGRDGHFGHPGLSNRRKTA